MRGVWVAGTIRTEGTVNSNEFKKQRAEERKKKFLEKKMHGQFTKEMSDSVEKEKSWYWLSRGDLKVETEALLCAAQEQALRKNYIKHNIDKSIDSPLCRMCGKCGESVNILIVGVRNLPRKSTREDTIMLLRRPIGICVRDMK